jgi:hypothetical protein
VRPGRGQRLESRENKRINLYFLLDYNEYMTPIFIVLKGLDLQAIYR